MQQKTRHLAMIFGCLVPVLLCASPGLAQDSEFQVNSYTTSEQRGPRIASLPSGGFIVVWESRLFPGGNTESNIIARRFDASFAPIEDDFLVAGAASEADRPAVATQPDGGFLVVWDADIGEHQQVRGQLFSSTGAPAGAAFTVHESTTVSAGSAMLAADDQGRFTALWFQDGLRLRRFDAAGAPIGSEAFVFTAPSLSVDLATRGDGRSMVFWGDPTAFRFRRYDADGASASVPTVAPLAGVGTTEIVATDEGYFLLGSLSNWDLVGRRVDPTGAALGTEFQLPNDIGLRPLTSLAHDGDSGFAFARQTLFVPGDNDSTGVEQGRLSPAGGLLSLQQLNTYTTNEQGRPDVAALADGTFLVVWESILSDSGDPNWSIQARRLSDDLFADGFESGDASAWADPPVP